MLDIITVIYHRHVKNLNLQQLLLTINLVLQARR